MEHPISQNPDSIIAVVGIDIGKNLFHVVGSLTNLEQDCITLKRIRPLAK